MSGTPDPAPMEGQVALIADAAIRVMVAQGLDAVSVRHVAAEAGVAPGTVQYHLKSRDAVIAAALRRSVERQIDRVRHLPVAEDHLDRLTAQLAELLPTGEVQREDAAVWVVLGAAASTRPWLAQAYDEALAVFRGSMIKEFRAAADADELPSGLTPEQAARMVTALVNGLTLDSLNMPEDCVDTLLDDLRAGLSLIIGA